MLVVGSGIAGLWSAYTLARAGLSVTVHTASDGPDDHCCSWWAGGMLAPDCEQQTAEPLIGELGYQSLALWSRFAQEVKADLGINIDFETSGTLVVTAPRDQSLLTDFARQTEGGQKLLATQVRDLEPELDHFEQALWFASEAHLNPRAATAALWQSLQRLQVSLQTHTKVSAEALMALSESYDWCVDCRGYAARDAQSDLRGVKGEMLYLRSSEVTLKRPIRFLHPRHPIYIVPRGNGEFMVGATMLESNESTAVTVRSTLELLSAAYTVHPAFAEAEVVEMGADIRPAYDDNLPQIRREANRLSLNGLYRHGFLVAPALASQLLLQIEQNRTENEVTHESKAERADRRHAMSHA